MLFAFFIENVGGVSCIFPLLELGWALRTEAV